ncbi:MAG TPA: hypothetical protein VHD81_10175 [Mycobacteriales bacterium]|nr:hypothetical protein [Mycobacteriales bacterium]
MSLSAPDFRALPRHDQVALGVGVLVFLASFLPWYGVTILGVSTSYTAWHAGLTAFGLILLLLATATTAAELFAKDALPELPVGNQVVEAGLAGVGALLVVIKSLDLPSGSGLGVDVGLRWGGWILILATVAQAGISVLRAVHANDGAGGVGPV